MATATNLTDTLNHTLHIIELTWIRLERKVDIDTVEIKIRHF